MGVLHVLPVRIRNLQQYPYHTDFASSSNSEGFDQNSALNIMFIIVKGKLRSQIANLNLLKGLKGSQKKNGNFQN